MTENTRALTPEQKRERVEAKIASRETRKERSSFNGTKGKLKIGHSIEGYHLHILNDTVGRIDEALSVGYEFVSPDEVGGTATNVVSRNTDIGDKVRFLVGKTDADEPLYAYLMKIKQEFYEEDQAALQAKNDAIDDAIRGGKVTKDGFSADGFYKPREGVKLSRG